MLIWEVHDMEYRVLGRTGIKVSAIGIGGEGFEKWNS